MINSKLETFRNKLKMTKSQFAAQLSITYDSLVKYENRQRNPNAKVACKILDLAKEKKFKLIFEDLVNRDLFIKAKSKKKSKATKKDKKSNEAKVQN